MTGPSGRGSGRRVAPSSARPAVLVSSLRLSIAESEVLHFLGYPEGRRPPARLEPLLADALREARELAAARGAFRRLPVAAAGEVGLPAESADALILGLVTIGPGLERRVTELLGRGDSSRAVILDAAGSAATEEAARRLSVRILGGRGGPGEDVGCRISPGFGRWPLAAQKALFGRLPHDALGVSLSPSMMMAPRKSISFALWIGARRAPRAGLSGCDTCGLPHCRYRRTAGGGRKSFSFEVTAR